MLRCNGFVGSIKHAYWSWKAVSSSQLRRYFLLVEFYTKYQGEDVQTFNLQFVGNKAFFVLYITCGLVNFPARRRNDPLINNGLMMSHAKSYSNCQKNRWVMIQKLMPIYGHKHQNLPLIKYQYFNNIRQNLLFICIVFAIQSSESFKLSIYGI